MTNSIVECPHCHYKFNYEFIPGVSFTSIRLGPARIFKCPNCKELHKFNINHFGTDPSLPTHGDNAETSIGGKSIALAAGPLIVLVALGILLVATDVPQRSCCPYSFPNWDFMVISLCCLSLLESNP